MVGGSGADEVYAAARGAEVAASSSSDDTSVPAQARRGATTPSEAPSDSAAAERQQSVMAEPEINREQMFPSLSPEEIGRLRRFGETRRYAAGTQIVTT